MNRSSSNLQSNVPVKWAKTFIPVHPPKSYTSQPLMTDGDGNKRPFEHQLPTISSDDRTAPMVSNPPPLHLIHGLTYWLRLLLSYRYPYAPLHRQRWHTPLSFRKLEAQCTKLSIFLIPLMPLNRDLLPCACVSIPLRAFLPLRCTQPLIHLYLPILHLRFPVWLHLHLMFCLILAPHLPFPVLMSQSLKHATLAWSCITAKCAMKLFTLSLNC